MNRECIGCGCSDDNACRGGCSWSHESEIAPLGICSNCEPEVDLEALEVQAQDWVDEYGELVDAGSQLLLPGDPEYHATLRGAR